MLCVEFFIKQSTGDEHVNILTAILFNCLFLLCVYTIYVTACRRIWNENILPRPVQ